MATMKSKAKSPETSRQASLMTFIAMGAMRGYSQAEIMLAGYCDAIDRGNRPDPKIEQRVSEAIKWLLLGEGSTEERASLMAKELGLLRKQGKQRSAAIDAPRLAHSVMDYEDLVPEIGEVAAVKQVAEFQGIGVRAMRDRIKKYGALAAEFRRAEALFPIGSSVGTGIGVHFGSEKKK